jgi:hypothetical protein
MPNIIKTEPHPLLLGRMLGPKVHKDFVNDGCSSVPDLYLKWPCLIHDWQYWQLRRAWEVIMKLRTKHGASIWTSINMFDMEDKDFAILLSIGVTEEEPGPDNLTWTITIKELIMFHHSYRELADKFLRANIKTLTRLKVKNGQVKRRSIFSRRLWGRGLNWAFYIGVRIGAGGASKKVSKMDEANRELEELIYGTS